jgi:two-component system osmolarity sensor histidine kinase EnvZ
MDMSWLKHSMPRSLYGRAALILVLPIVTLQLVISIVFIQRHFEDVTQQMTRNVLLDLRMFSEALNAANTPTDAIYDSLQSQRALQVEVRFSDVPETGFRRLFYDISGRTVMRTLQAGLPGLTGVDLSRSIREVHLRVDSPHGPFAFSFSRRQVSASNPHQLLVLMVFTGVVMTGVSFLYLRNQLRPITRLARAAEAFGKGRMEPYSPSGAVEVRAAGNAFLAMRSRIERQTQQRTLMLSGVSHDLRTPLTRLRLGLSMQGDDPEIRALERDVEDMETLVTTFLDFARSDALDDPTKVDPIALAKEIVEQASRNGEPVTLNVQGGPPQMMPLRPNAVKRALWNLIGNALRYGEQAAVSVVITERMVRFSVEDDGPGIPEALREEALRPFARLDASRNQDKGPGVGLGLSIAIDIARSHGGTLRLDRSARLGGLQADLILAR